MKRKKSRAFIIWTVFLHDLQLVRFITPQQHYLTSVQCHVFLCRLNPLLCLHFYLVLIISPREKKRRWKHASYLLDFQCPISNKKGIKFRGNLSSPGNFPKKQELKFPRKLLDRPIRELKFPRKLLDHSIREIKFPRKLLECYIREI